ncbi:hypothetical protein JKP88DRAFT_193354, partial [Tribonema minus]
MLHLLEGLGAGADVHQQVTALTELTTSLTMASGYMGNVRLGPIMPSLLALLASPSSEVALQATRALIAAIDIAPHAAAAVAADGGLDVLCGHLLRMADIDLAEQCLRCLRLVAAEAPRAVVAAGGLRACMAFFDFFPRDLRRLALSVVAALCASGALGRAEDLPR